MKNNAREIGIVIAISLAIIFGFGLLRGVFGSLFGDTAADWIVGILKWGGVLALIVLAVLQSKKRGDNKAHVYWIDQSVNTRQERAL